MDSVPCRARALLTLVIALAGCTSEGDETSRRGAYRLRPGDALPGGAVATARPGDWALASAELRAVVQDATPSPWLLDGRGGHLADLERIRAGERSPDLLKLAIPTVQFQLSEVSSIAFDGASADARLRVDGTACPFGLLPDFLPVGRDVNVRVATEYRIEPGNGRFDPR